MKLSSLSYSFHRADGNIFLGRVYVPFSLSVHWPFRVDAYQFGSQLTQLTGVSPMCNCARQLCGVLPVNSAPQ